MAKDLLSIYEPIQKNDISKGDEEQQKVFTSEPKQQSIQTIQPKLVDNLPKKNNFNSDIEAPEAEPISKSQIDHGEETVAQTQPTQSPIEYGGKEEPVKKSDIEPEISRDNELTKSYNDMLDRIDNLYKDEDENDEENLR